MKSCSVFGNSARPVDTPCLRLARAGRRLIFAFFLQRLFRSGLSLCSCYLRVSVFLHARVAVLWVGEVWRVGASSLSATGRIPNLFWRSSLILLGSIMAAAHSCGLDILPPSRLDLPTAYLASPFLSVPHANLPYPNPVSKSHETYMYCSFRAGYEVSFIRFIAESR